MIKQAILIASSKKGENAKSFKSDVAFFKAFLKSERGGCWFEPEIITLLDPSLEEILAAINKDEQNYRLIYYTGHGCTSGNEQYILVKNTLVNISKLLNKAKREVAIFDCCRTQYPYEEIKAEYIIKESRFMAKGLRVRKRYDTLIQQNIGQLIAFVTEKGKYARAVPSGSFFIHALEEALEKFKQADIKGVVSFNKVMQCIDMIFEERNMQQRVKIRTNCKAKYPFYIG